MIANDPARQGFGGTWTEEKLRILEAYLDAYTAALKDRKFTLAYIDAFAGTGEVEIRRDQDPETRQILEGSAKIACSITDKPFDMLLFVEKDEEKAKKLHLLEPDSNRITVHNREANPELRRICQPQFSGFWKKTRGVVFLDPFALQVEWATVEAIASTQALDTWILFPIGAVSRLMPRSKRPDDVDPRWAARLTRVFGYESWRDNYRESPQPLLFGDEDRWERTEGLAEIAKLY